MEDGDGAGPQYGENEQQWDWGVPTKGKSACSKVNQHFTEIILMHPD